MTRNSDPTPRGMRRWRLFARLAVAILVAGVAAGIIGIAMAYLLEGFEWLFYGVAYGTLEERVAQAPAWRRVLAPATAGVVAGAAWWWQRRRGGVVSVEAVIADCGGPGPRAQDVAERIGLWRPCVDAVIQVLTVGGGNSVGREGAPRLAAGAFAVQVARWLDLDRTWTAIIAASAAGAGLAAMYNAPLGGAAYAVELMMLTGMRRRGAAAAVVTSVLATVVSWWHSHALPAIAMPHAPASGGTLAACVLVAGLAWLAGLAARCLWAWVRVHQCPPPASLPLAIGGAGLLTGCASLWLVVMPGNGKDAFQSAIVSDATTTALVIVLGVVALKPLLTAATLGAGATGGLLAPSFSLGASVGVAVGIGLHAAGVDVSLAALALLGAGVTLAVTQRAPVFAAIFVWELTHGPLWMVPVLFVACLATMHIPALAARWHGRSSS